jgi:hypothetical protein
MKEGCRLAIDSDRRRMIFNQVRTKAVLRGMPMDEDPEFLAWIDLWISGEYSMSELRSRYSDLTARRAHRSQASTQNTEAADNHDKDADHNHSTDRESD